MTEDTSRCERMALEAEDRFRNLSGPEIIAEALAMTMGTQADLARLSGLTNNTVTTLKQGKRPNAAQRAALCWAVFRRWAPRRPTIKD